MSSPIVVTTVLPFVPLIVFIFAIILVRADPFWRTNVLDPTSKIGFSGAFGKRRLNQACLKAAGGVSLKAGSHSRQPLRKSINNKSSQLLRALDHSRLPGGPRILPRRERPPFRTVVPSGNVVEVQYRGWPLELMKVLARLD